MYFGIPEIIIKPNEDKKSGIAGEKIVMLRRKETFCWFCILCWWCTHTAGIALNNSIQSAAPRNMHIQATISFFVIINTARHTTVEISIRVDIDMPAKSRRCSFCSWPSNTSEKASIILVPTVNRSTASLSPSQWVTMPYSHAHSIITPQDVMRFITYSPML